MIPSGLRLRTWLEIGKKHTGKDSKRQKIDQAIEELDWMQVPGKNDPPLRVGMMPGENIKEIIQQLRMPNVSAVAISSELAPCGLYGIEANYVNGRARLYVLDEGHACTPLASDFWPKEESRGNETRSG